MFPNWLRWFGTRRTYRATSRNMTPAESKAFDKVFEKMGETFNAMDEFFDVARSVDGAPPPRPNTSNEGAKGSNHDG